MGRMQRNKGARVEREIVNLHHDIGIAASKESRSGHTGPDLLIGDDLVCEVKARRNGEGFTQLERWLGNNDVLFLKRDRQKPMVCLSWSTWIRLVRAVFRGDPIGHVPPRNAIVGDSGASF